MTKSEYYKKIILLFFTLIVCIAIIITSVPYLSEIIGQLFSKPIAEKVNYFLILILFGGVAGYFMGAVNSHTREWKKQRKAPDEITELESVVKENVSTEEQTEIKTATVFMLTLVAILTITTIATGDIYTEIAPHFYLQLYSLFFIPSLVLLTAYTMVKMPYLWKMNHKKDSLFMVFISSIILSFSLSGTFKLINSKLGGQSIVSSNFRIISSAPANNNMEILLETDTGPALFLLPKSLCDNTIENDRFPKNVYVGSLGYRYIKDVR